MFCFVFKFHSSPQFFNSTKIMCSTIYNTDAWIKTVWKAWKVCYSQLPTKSNIYPSVCSSSSLPFQTGYIFVYTTIYNIITQNNVHVCACKMCLVFCIEIQPGVQVRVGLHEFTSLFDTITYTRWAYICIVFCIEVKE